MLDINVKKDSIQDIEKKLKEENSSKWINEYFGTKQGKEEKSIESLLTIGNGIFAIRGTDILDNSESYKATYVAGLFNKVYTKIADRNIANEDFVNVGELFGTDVFIDGEKIEINNLLETELIKYRYLNMQTGQLFYTYLIRKNNKTTLIESTRFISLSNSNFASAEIKVTPLDYNGEIKIVDKTVKEPINFGVERYQSLKHDHFSKINNDINDDIITMNLTTSESNIKVLYKKKLVIKDNDYEIEVSADKEEIKRDVKANVNNLESMSITINVSLASSFISEDYEEIVNQNIKINEVDELTKSINKWKEVWDKINIEINEDDPKSELLTTNAYHLITSFSENTENKDVSLGARGLHGEAYRGHIFWDEIFIMPFYAHHFPNVAKELINYRYNRLDIAKEEAVKENYSGALYPWQSGRLGDECSQEYHLNPLDGSWHEDSSRYQRHVSLAIAYNIIYHLKETNDIKFFEEKGIPTLVEIIKFWQGKLTYNEKEDRYSILNVMGPDEFHEDYPGASTHGLKDNAYTNVLVSWLFNECSSLFENKDNAKEIELKKLKEQSKKLKINIVDGVIDQYDGFLNLKDVNLKEYKEKYGNIYRMDRILKSEGKDPNEYKVIKQADTLMLFYLFSKDEIKSLFNNLGYDLTDDVIEKTFNYYLSITSHGSTLSRIVHAVLAHNFGYDELAEELYIEALGSDYNDIQGGTTAEGIHSGVMAASTFVFYRLYAGIDFSLDIFNLDFNNSFECNKLEFKINFKGNEYEVFKEGENIKVSCSNKNIENYILNGQKVKLG